MPGVSVSDRDTSTGVLSFDLRDLLKLLNNRVLQSHWCIVDLECLGGKSADILHQASDDKRHLEGAELINLAIEVDQIIDGEFTGWLPGDTEPWVIIRAVDSSAFDVITDDTEVLLAIKRNFSEVIDLPE
jgi:hypothetical protein